MLALLRRSVCALLAPIAGTWITRQHKQGWIDADEWGPSEQSLRVSQWRVIARTFTVFTEETSFLENLSQMRACWLAARGSSVQSSEAPLDAR
jgi:hypothetical protein